MKRLITACVMAWLLVACDDSRVYEQVVDLQQRHWIVTEKPTFDFAIQDTSERYNLYGYIRNAVSYPYSRVFFTYYLKDSTGREIEKKLMTEFLFDAKTGKPFGKSGIGDLYDHQFILLQDYQFNTAGKYRLELEQFMRLDTLPGILAVGVRVEKSRHTN
jgi:gliding motility-associated lipoprotein GldH